MAMKTSMHHSIHRTLDIRYEDLLPFFKGFSEGVIFYNVLEETISSLPISRSKNLRTNDTRIDFGSIIHRSFRQYFFDKEKLLSFEKGFLRRVDCKREETFPSCLDEN